jgi:hypothetical protein
MKKPFAATKDDDASAPEKPAVLKPFNTHNRRFKVGVEITRADLAGSALDYDHLVERGFISKPAA